MVKLVYILCAVLKEIYKDIKDIIMKIYKSDSNSDVTVEYVCGELMKIEI